MIKQKRWIGGIFAAVLLAGCTGPQIVLKNARTQENSSLQASFSAWMTYHNHTLGFSIDLPQKIYVGSENDFAPVRAQEDRKNGDVYISPQFFYDQQIDQVSSEHTRTDLTVDLLKTAPPATLGFWHIKSLNLEESQLEPWIKITFGAGCSVGQKNPTAQLSVVELIIQGDDKSLESKQCPASHLLFLRYSQQRHRLIYWNLGENPAFLDGPNGTIASDLAMLKSFRFE